MLGGWSAVICSSAQKLISSSALSICGWDCTALGAVADVAQLKATFRAHGIGAGPLRAASASFGTSAHDQGGDHQFGQGLRRPDDLPS